MSGGAYSSLAAVYDKLNSSVDYKAIADYIERQFSHFQRGKILSVLDLACGTGSVTIELAGRGYDMTGVDLSEEMLSEARAKCDSGSFRHDVLLIKQNMADLELYGTVNAVVCCLDSLNYLTDTASLARTFNRVHNYLDPDGLFVFDMNAPARFRVDYADNSYLLEDDGIFCAWQNSYNEKTKICDFYLSIFRETSPQVWERFDELQRERCYSLKTVKKLLTEASFEICSISGDMEGGEVDSETKRWYITARAKK